MSRTHPKRRHLARAKTIIDQTAGTLRDAKRTSSTPRRARTGNPVRRNSYQAGDRELERWKADNIFPEHEHNARMRSAEAFELKTRKPGRKNGALGHVGLEVFRFLLRTRNRRSGRLDWAHSQIAGELRRSTSAVRAALQRLRKAGFIDWLRRTQPIEDPEPGGQVVEQISNAYFFGLPRLAKTWVRRMLGRPTEAMRDAAAERARRQRTENTDPAELVAGIAGNGLRSALDHLLRNLEQGES